MRCALQGWLDRAEWLQAALRKPPHHQQRGGKGIAGVVWSPANDCCVWSLVVRNIGDSESRIGRFRIGRAIRTLRFQGIDRLRFGLAILNRFTSMLVHGDSAQFCASRCGHSGDSNPAILGIVRFSIRCREGLERYRTMRW